MFISIRALLFVFVVAALRAETSLDHAFRAQALLGPEIWSKVISIHNETRAGRYPRTVHALVFELGERLWFYTDVDGTQSFSLHRGRLEEEKRDFGPLLRDIEPGFARWSEETPPGPAPARKAREKLPNGCFIESFAGLRERVAHGARLEEPRLLSYYSETAAGRRGHTVLAYDAGARVEIFDPDRPGARLAFPKSIGTDALALARALDGKEIVRARYFSLRGNATTELLASAAQSGAKVASWKPAVRPDAVPQ